MKRVVLLVLLFLVSSPIAFGSGILLAEYKLGWPNFKPKQKIESLDLDEKKSIQNVSELNPKPENLALPNSGAKQEEALEKLPDDVVKKPDFQEVKKPQETKSPSLAPKSADMDEDLEEIIEDPDLKI